MRQSKYSRKKHRIRAIYRATTFLVLIIGSCIYNGISNSKLASRHVEQITKEFNIPPLFKNEREHQNGIKTLSNRRLFEENNDDTNAQEKCSKLRPNAKNKLMFLLYVAGVFYMFLAIAIVCDEFFVPALEEMASENYLNLSMDVAGATLMAAGGSAPELFTSMIGTFQRSEVGFGTIVGSAVFNVLFVIGICAMASKEVLTLTRWPLLRDCVYYSIGLGTLALFCGVSSPGEIELWEALVQFTIYIGYVVFMKYNDLISRKVQKSLSNNKVSAENTLNDKEQNSETLKSTTVGSTKTSMFRASLLNLLIGNGSLLDKVGIAMVTKISGDIDTVFKKLDESGDGYIDYNEFHHLVTQLSDNEVASEEIDKAIAELDDDNDGKIDLKEFTKWYITSESRLRKELKRTFDKFDINNSGTIDKIELRQLMKDLGTEVKDEDINAILYEILSTDEYGSDSEAQMSFLQFESWYINSQYWNEHKSKIDACADDAVEPVSDHLKPPKDGDMKAYLRWIMLLPIIFLLCLTVPDVRQPGRSKLCYFAFLLSIIWIGWFTYFMVVWAETIGNTVGVPIGLMGLTVLAAGTSVPDLLSSVIVARMGEGDMAVSSSIGSNIFDITVGLPIPWVIFILTNSAKEKTVHIGTAGMEISIVLLLCMLICIITMIHFNGWKMSKQLGFGMFILYFLYLAQAIFRQLPLKLCSR